MKKILVILIAVMLCVSVLTGCGDIASKEGDRIEIQLEGERGMIVVPAASSMRKIKALPFFPTRFRSAMPRSQRKALSLLF